MLAGVQILGILFALSMIYITYVYYKRKNYNLRSLVLWLAVWTGTLVLISVPQTVYGVMQALQIERTADFFVVAGFAFFSVIIFYMYIILKKTNQKLEDLVRQTSFYEADKTNKKKKNKK